MAVLPRISKPFTSILVRSKKHSHLNLKDENKETIRLRKVTAKNIAGKRAQISQLFFLYFNSRLPLPVVSKHPTSIYFQWQTVVLFLRWRVPSSPIYFLVWDKGGASSLEGPTRTDSMSFQCPTEAGSYYLHVTGCGGRRKEDWANSLTGIGLAPAVTHELSCRWWEKTNKQLSWGKIYWLANVLLQETSGQVCLQCGPTGNGSWSCTIPFLSMTW